MSLDKINKITKTQLFGLINENLGRRVFSLKKVFTLLPEFNHSKRIYTLLQELVKDGKIEMKDNNYQVSKVKVESFVRDFVSGKDLNVNATTLSIDIESKLGITADKKDILQSLRTALNNTKYNSSDKIIRCPRCNTNMTSITLSDNRPGYYCQNDRVTLPR